ncbi:hypothetical protein A2U01_0087150, partial [Trifolium medium]|nr:hypothetical protein [Trifolium medium]
PVESPETLEDTTTSEASPEPEGEEVDAKETVQPKNTFKYKSSELGIPRKT